MKRLSDYKGEEALELWGDLIKPLSVIMTNAKVKKVATSEDRTIATIAGAVLKECPKEVNEILLRIDNSEYNGFSLVQRVISIIMEFSNSEEFTDFFKLSEQENEQNVSSGSVTENTAGVGK